MHKIPMKRLLRHLITVIPLLALLVSLTIPAAVNATSHSCNARFFTFPAWYEGVTTNGCQVVLNQLTDVWIIVLNLLEFGFQLIGYFAVGYIIWGGFKYIKSEGNPSKVGEAKQTILYAIIGLGLALSSVALVSFISGLFQTS